MWARLDRTQPRSALRTYAKRMRAEPTQAEQKLWWHLSHRLGLEWTHFRRQVRFGRYIADFVSHGAKLVIEVDGGQHDEQALADAERCKFIEAQGYRVLRFWNNQVLGNIDGVLEEIHPAVTTTPTPNPSPQRGGEQRPSRGG
ncbi:MAG: endonuclease domain-containing protein [Xanthobacteraceae bacterium]|nr:endonuclease domain-containing protein [Xanthobacteraceae bacterium]